MAAGPARPSASGPLSLAVDAEYLALRSDRTDVTQAAGRLRRLRVAASSSYTPLPTMTVGAALWGGSQSSDGVETDRQAGGGASISVRVSAFFDVVGRYDLLVDRSQAGGPDYSRRVLTVALVGRVATPPRRAAAAAAVDGDLAPQVEGVRVRFRVRVAGASRVVVIGSWNDWASGQPRQELRRTTDPDLWEAWVDVGAGGEHRYHFIVDERPARPMGAPRYRADGFGGEDGVLELADDAASKGGAR